MKLKKYPWGEFIEFQNDTVLSSVEEKYIKGNYSISIECKISDEFEDFFTKNFISIKKLHLKNENEGELFFLYKLRRLEELVLHFYAKMDICIDFSKINNLKKLGMNWYYKYYKNFESQKELIHLSLSDFTEKDFNRLPKFEKLKSFRSVGGKLKTLTHIENINNIVALEISAHRSLTDISQIQHCKNLKYIEINTCWKMADFSPIGELKELEVLRIIDCKNLESIKFVKDMPNLRHLEILGTSLINDLDTTPAEHIPVFLGSLETKYNKHYPEKEENIQPYGRKQFY